MISGERLCGSKMHLPCLKYELVYEHLGGVSEGRKDLQPASSLLCQETQARFFPGAFSHSSVHSMPRRDAQ